MGQPGITIAKGAFWTRGLAKCYGLLAKTSATRGGMGWVEATSIQAPDWDYSPGSTMQRAGIRVAKKLQGMDGCAK